MSRSAPVVWLLEGHASQRNLAQAIRQGLPQVYRRVSHSGQRPEILGEAELGLTEPKPVDERIPWVLAQLRMHPVDLLHAGQHGDWYEPYRQTIEQYGVQLITGARHVDTFAQLEDKAHFIRVCEAHNLPVTPAVTVQDAVAMQQAIDALAGQPVCVKPVQGVYAAGFWRLEVDASAFAALSYPEQRLARTDWFVDSYRQLSDPLPYLVMPYLDGQEYSVDCLCQGGSLLGAIIRSKYDSHQDIVPWLPDQAALPDSAEQAVLQLAMQAVALFACDGLVNVQLREDRHGQPHLLEINARPSGGIGYGLPAGLNLPALMVAHWLQLELVMPPLQRIRVRVVDLPLVLA